MMRLRKKKKKKIVEAITFARGPPTMFHRESTSAVWARDKLLEVHEAIVGVGNVRLLC